MHKVNAKRSQHHSRAYLLAVEGGGGLRDEKVRRVQPANVSRLVGHSPQNQDRAPLIWSLRVQW
jgi:hypothetical protein